MDGHNMGALFMMYHITCADGGEVKEKWGMDEPV